VDAGAGLELTVGAQDAVFGPNDRSLDGALVDRELVAERDVLDS
jgi:hypothetical protein